MTIQSPCFRCGVFCISSLTWAYCVAYLSDRLAKACVGVSAGITPTSFLWNLFKINICMKNLLQVFAVCIPLVATAVSCYDDSELRGKIETLENTTIAGIKSQISKLESKDAELKDKIDALEKSQASKEEINALKAKDTEIENKISDLKAWAEDLFKNYYTKEEIDSKVNAINVAISELDKALKALEDRVKALEDKLVQVEITLTYPQGNVCLSGTSVEITYTLENADEKTEIYAMVDGLWSVKVVPTDYKSGNIVVTLPEAAYGYNTDANVIVFVNKGGIVSTKAFDIVAGVITSCDNTGIDLGWQEGTFTFNLSSNFDYSVDIDCDWIEVISTKASVVEHSASFSYTENPEDNPARYGVVNLRTPSGDVFCSINVLQSPQPASDPIVFADKNVEKKCVEAFDTNGDGKLSYKEAANVNFFPNAKTDEGFWGEYRRTIKSFDELQYFTSLSNVVCLFMHCSNLESVVFPNSESIQYSTFERVCMNCTNLKRVVLPDNITVIGYSAFYNTSSLEGINVPSTLLRVDDSAFRGSSIKAFDAPEGLLQFGSGCFQSSSIESFRFPSGVIKIPSYIFSNCTKLKKVEIPEGVIEIGTYAFHGSCLSQVTIPSTVTFIDEGAFICTGLIQVTCLATIPPVISRGNFGNYNPVNYVSSDVDFLYVPTESVEAYKNSGWAQYFKNILPIE